MVKYPRYGSQDSSTVLGRLDRPRKAGLFLSPFYGSAGLSFYPAKRVGKQALRERVILLGGQDTVDL